MLNPNERLTYLAELQAPTDYELDFAIATTYSLNLMTLLMAPLSMVFRTSGVKEETPQEPIALLEALRRSANRFVVFCDQGQIAVPKRDEVLYRYLESAVIQVQAPNGGVFHPKIWLLRFVPLTDGRPVLYRLLTLSRNLTFDRSWDTILTLEGTVADRRVGYGETRPLGDFIAALPGLACVKEQGARCKAKVDEIAAEVRRVKFEAPAGFSDELRFEPVGIPGYRRVQSVETTRRLILSPFLSPDLIQPLAESGRNHVLISRREELDALDPAVLHAIKRRGEIFLLSDDVEQPTAEAPEPAPSPALQGLHAKIYIDEHKYKATLRTGSVNATHAAWSGQNVEFQVALTGTYSQAGIKGFLGDGQKGSLGQLLVPYQIPPAARPAESVQKQLEGLLRKGRSALIDATLAAQVTGGEAGRFDLSLQPTLPITLPAGITATCYPISLQRHLSQPLGADGAQFTGLSLVGLTGFIAVELTVEAQGQRLTEGCVLNLPVVGMPEERLDGLIQHLISDRSRFLRYLLFLLAEGDEAATAQGLLDVFSMAAAGSEGAMAMLELPLLEEMVRAFSRHPEKIERIGKLVRQLTANAATKDLLPEGFVVLWSAFAAAHEKGRPE